MVSKKNVMLALSAVAATVVMSGCWTESEPAPVARVAGTVIDGYIGGATVFIDLNNNGQKDADEPSAITDAKGDFSITSNDTTHPLIMIGGTDMGTGLPFTGKLEAPAGSKVVTPLTSMIQAIVKSGKTAAQAEVAVKAALGIPATTNLATFDPFEAASTGTVAEKAVAQTVLAQTAKIQTIVESATATIAAADGASNATAMENVFAALATNFANATTPLVLTDAAIETAINSAANAVYASSTNDTPAQAAAKTAALANVTAAAPSVAATTNDVANGAAETIAAATNPTLAFNTAMIVSGETLVAEITTAVEAHTEVSFTAAEQAAAEQAATNTAENLVVHPPVITGATGN